MCGICVCVRIFTCEVCLYMCAYVCGGHRSTFGVLFDHSPPYRLKKDLSLEPKAHQFIQSVCYGDPLLLPPKPPTPPSINISARELNCCPHTYMPCALPGGHLPSLSLG